MNVTEETDRTVYTIAIPEMKAFRENCDSEPMTKGWFIVPDIDAPGWTTVRVPAWEKEIYEFYAFIARHTAQSTIEERTPNWFEGINPEVAKAKGVDIPSI